MSDEKIEQPATIDDSGNTDKPEPSDVADDGNTDTRSPDVSGGQPPVGDDKPRNTEF